MEHNPISHALDAPIRPRLPVRARADEVGGGHGGIDFEAALGTDEGEGEVMVGHAVVEHQVDGVDFEVDLGGERGVVPEVEDAPELGAHGVVVRAGSVFLGEGFGIADDGVSTIEMLRGCGGPGRRDRERYGYNLFCVRGPVNLLEL